MAFFLAVGLGILVEDAAFAQTYNDNATMANNWSSAGSWSGSSIPTTSGTANVIGMTGMVATGFTSNNNLGTVNVTTFNDSHPGSGVLTVSGGTLNFDGASPGTNLLNLSSGAGDTFSTNFSLTNGLTITANATQNYTLNNVISGTGPVIYNGANGTFTLAGSANTYTGGTTLNGPQFIVSKATAFGASTGAVLFNAGNISTTSGSGTLTLANSFQIGGNVSFLGASTGTYTNFSISGGIDLLGANRTINVANSGITSSSSTFGILTFSGIVSDGGLTKAGVGALLLTGGSANTYAGGTVINNGILQFATNTDIPSLALSGANSILINSGGALAVNASGLTTVSGWLGDSRLSNASAGTIALVGDSSENINFRAGGFNNLFLGAFANTTYTGTITPGSNGYNLGGGGATLTLSNTNTLTGTNTLIVGPALTLASIGGATVTAAQAGSGGAVTLSAPNNLSGPTTINSIPLGLAGNGGLGSSDLTLTPGGSLSIAASAAGSVTRANSLTFNRGTLTVTGPAVAGTAIDTITGSMVLNSGANTISIVPNSAGDETLTAAGLGRAPGQGWALVNGLNLGQDSTTTTNTGRITFTTAPTLVGITAALSSGINSSAQNTQIVPWLVGAVATTNGASTGTLSATANTFLTYNSATGLRPLNLTSEFTSNAISSGNNTYLTGATSASSTASINSLVMGTSGSLAIGTGAVLTDASGALLFSSLPSNTATISAVGTGAFDFGGAEGIVTVNSSVTGSISAAITGTSGLSKFGAGTLNLTGTSSYTGGTRIEAGTLTTNFLANGGSNSAIGADTNAASNLVLDGGILTYTGTAVSSDRLFSVGTSGGAIVSSSGGALNLTNSATIGYNGETGARIFTLGGTTSGNVLAAVIGDNGGPTSVIKNGNGGSWELTGASTYTGSTMIQGDTNNSGGILIVTTLANGGSASSIGASSNAASNLMINKGTLQYIGGTASTDRLFSLGSAGTDAIDSSGSGSLTFTNTGTIGFVGTGSRNLTLTGSNTGANTLASVLADSSATAASGATGLIKTGAGTWYLAGVNTYTGNTTISVGTLGLSGAGLLGGGSYAGTISNNGTFSFNSSAAQVLSGVISGTGAVTENGPGQLTLSGSNTYSGGTTITGGTLVAGTSTAILGGTISSGPFGKGTLALGPGTTLDDNGTAITIANALTLNGTISFGSTGSGSLNFSGAGLTTSGTVTILGNTDLYVTNTTTIADNISNTGNFSFNKYGSGTLNLTGTGSNLGTAATTVSTGALMVATTSSIGSGLVSLANGTALQYNGTSAGTFTQAITVTGTSATINNISGQVLSLTGTLTKNGTILNITGGSNVISGAIVGSLPNSDVNYNGHSITGLTSTASTYNGPTTISGTSTLLTGVSGALPTAGGTYTALTLGAGSDVAATVNTLDLLGTSQTVAGINDAGSGTNQIISSNGSATTPAIGTGPSSLSPTTSTGTLTVNVASGTDTFGSNGGLLGDSNNGAPGRNANSFSLTKGGTGTLALTGASGNTYTGGTTITAGTLLVSNTSGSATGTGALNLNSGAILTGTGTIAVTGNAMISGTVNVGSGGTTDILAMTASGTTNFTGAHLAFNLDTDLGGSSSELALGNTPAVIFGGGASLTINLSGTLVRTIPADYTLFTTTSGTNVFSGLTLTNGYTDGSIIKTGLTLNMTGANAGVYAGTYLELVSNNGGGFNIVAVIPEPSTWALMLAGFALVFIYRRAHDSSADRRRGQ